MKNNDEILEFAKRAHQEGKKARLEDDYLTFNRALGNICGMKNVVHIEEGMSDLMVQLEELVSDLLR